MTWMRGFEVTDFLEIEFVHIDGLIDPLQCFWNVNTYMYVHKWEQMKLYSFSQISVGNFIYVETEYFIFPYTVLFKFPSKFEQIVISNWSFFGGNYCCISVMFYTTWNTFSSTTCTRIKHINVVIVTMHAVFTRWWAMIVKSGYVCKM